MPYSSARIEPLMQRSNQHKHGIFGGRVGVRRNKFVFFHHIRIVLMDLLEHEKQQARQQDADPRALLELLNEDRTQDDEGDSRAQAIDRHAPLPALARFRVGLEFEPVMHHARLRQRKGREHARCIQRN